MSTQNSVNEDSLRYKFIETGFFFQDDLEQLEIAAWNGTPFSEALEALPPEDGSNQGNLVIVTVFATEANQFILRTIAELEEDLDATERIRSPQEKAFLKEERKTYLNSVIPFYSPGF